MKIFKKTAAALFSAVLISVLFVNVSAENVVGYDYAPAGDDFVYYDFTAEDGAVGKLIFTKDGDGNLLYSSYKIDAPTPKSPEDFPNSDYQVFFDENEFFDYVDGLSSGDSPQYAGIVSKFEVEFDPPVNNVISMEGEKYYIADFETMTVSYAGYSIVCEEVAEEYPQGETLYRECTAEDGMKFGLFFDRTENGLEYAGWENEMKVSEVDYAYSTDENSRVIISSIVVGEIDIGRPLYSDPDMIPLEANEQLAVIDAVQYIEDELGRTAALLNIKKYYVITVDGMDSTVRYAGCSYKAVDMYTDFEPDDDSNWSEGATKSPNTGNSGGCLNTMLAAAAIAVLAKRTEK